MALDKLIRVLDAQVEQLQEEGRAKGAEAVVTRVIPPSEGHGPRFMLRGEGLLNRNSSDSESLSNFGANLGLSLMLGSKPIEDSDSEVLESWLSAAETGRGASGD